MYVASKLCVCVVHCKRRFLSAHIPCAPQILERHGLQMLLMLAHMQEDMPPELVCRLHTALSLLDTQPGETYCSIFLSVYSSCAQFCHSWWHYTRRMP